MMVIEMMMEIVQSLEKGYLVGYGRVVESFIESNEGLLSVDNILGFVHGCIVAVVVGVGLCVDFVERLLSCILV